jgi:hypothetical protein
MNRYSLLLHSGLLLAVSSCLPRQAATAIAAPETARGLEEVITEGNFEWEWFAGSGQIDMESPFFSGSGQFVLRMRQDSLAWMVIRYAGLEVARLQANEDSVVLLNRFEGSVDTYSWDELARISGFPGSLLSLQRLVMGWLPLAPAQWQVTSETDGKADVLAKAGAIQMNATYEGGSYRLTHCRILDTASGIEVKGRQEGWSPVDGRDMPRARQWEMRPEPDSRVFLQVLLEDGSFQGPLQFPFQVPSRYRSGG